MRDVIILASYEYLCMWRKIFMKYFKTDGIRGTLLKTLPSSLIFSLGKSLNCLPFSKCLIGYDTRESALLYKNALSCGLIEGNKEVIDLGIITTGGLSFLSRKYNALGVMITASHNNSEYNGVKIFLNGNKLSNEEEEKIENLIDKRFSYEGTSLGKMYSSNLIDEYKNYLLSLIKPYKLRIGLDFANGSLYRLGRDVFSCISDDLFIIGDKPNGKNINEMCGSLYPSSLRKIVLDNNCDIGFAFDGDADRILVFDNLGNMYNGDSLIYVIAKYLKKHNRLKNNAVCLVETTNLGVINSFRKNGIDVLLSPVGDKNVSSLMKEKDLILGGETSGHIINFDSFFVGEGIINAIYLLNVLHEENLALKELTSDLEYYFEYSKNFEIRDKSLVEDEEIRKYIKKKEFENNNRLKIVLRCSGTEDVIRMYVCAYEKKILNEVVSELESLIAIKSLDLREKVNCNMELYHNLDNVIIDKEAIIEEGVQIHPFSIIKGKTRICKGSIIGPNTEIEDSFIGADSLIKHSLVSSSFIGNNVVIGPFAHIRNKSIIKDGVVIGNFVEIKNSFLDIETKAKHLSYIGDTVCGKNVNWGCGSITVNYDGKNKYKTIVKDKAFIGSNVNLIAPLEIGKNAFIAGGSTITEDVMDDSFSIARSKQITKENYHKGEKK